MIAQSSDCVVVVVAESERLLGVPRALLHSCPISALIWVQTECGGLHLDLRARPAEDYPLGFECGECGEPAGCALSCCITMHSLGSSTGVLPDPVLSFL